MISSTIMILAHSVEIQKQFHALRAKMIVKKGLALIKKLVLALIL